MRSLQLSADSSLGAVLWNATWAPSNAALNDVAAWVLQATSTGASWYTNGGDTGNVYVVPANNATYFAQRATGEPCTNLCQDNSFAVRGAAVATELCGDRPPP